MNSASAASRFCAKHRDRADMKKAGWVVGGMVVGNALIPGIGGAAGGAVTGLIVDALSKRERAVGKKRVFVSFDFDNDRALKDFIIGQSKLADSPFSIVDCSLKEAAPMKTWEEKARRAIEGADLVLVVVGRATYRASGVLKEVAMARDAGVPIVQIIGYKEGAYTPVEGAGRLYRWSWDNLKKLLS